MFMGRPLPAALFTRCSSKAVVVKGGADEAQVYVLNHGKAIEKGRGIDVNIGVRN